MDTTKSGNREDISFPVLRLNAQGPISSEELIELVEEIRKESNGGVILPVQHSLDFRMMNYNVDGFEITYEDGTVAWCANWEDFCTEMLLGLSSVPRGQRLSICIAGPREFEGENSGPSAVQSDPVV